MITLRKISKTNKGKTRVHIEGDHRRPMCGGRRAGKDTHWQVDIGGVEIVNCLACMKIAIKKLSTRRNP